MSELPSSTPQTPPPNKPSPVLLLFLALPLLGIVVALVMLANEGRRTPASALPQGVNPNTATLINFSAPYFELDTLEGTRVRLEDYRGRVVFINFWQTTCEPCKREMPAFADFLAEHEGEAVSLLAINFDETPEQVQAFLTQYNISGVPIALDKTSTVRRSYGVANIPVTFIVDADGVVRNMHLGEMKADALLAEYNAAKNPSSSGS